MNDEALPVSVIIPCRNMEKYIERSVLSILNQSHQAFEIIIVNDGSTDNTEGILAPLMEKDRRIKLISSRVAVGLCESLNRGIEAAQYEWVARMDADDLSLPKRLERQIEYIRKYPDVKLVGCLPYYIDENDVILGKMILDTFTPAEFYAKIAAGKLIFIPGGASMIHKSTLQKLGSFKKEFEFIEDLELNMRFALNRYLTLNVPEYLYMYRKRELSNLSDVFQTNRRMRWVKERVRSIRMGTHVPSYEEYCRMEKSTPILQRMRIFQEDWGSFFFKRAGLNLAARKLVRAFVFLVCAFLVKPSYTLRKLKPQITDVLKKICPARS